jgi:hypothetical protein
MPNTAFFIVVLNVTYDSQHNNNQHNGRIINTQHKQFTALSTLSKVTHFSLLC